MRNRFDSDQSSDLLPNLVLFNSELEAADPPKNETAEEKDKRMQELFDAHFAKYPPSTPQGKLELSLDKYFRQSPTEELSVDRIKNAIAQAAKKEGYSYNLWYRGEGHYMYLEMWSATEGRQFFVVQPNNKGGLWISPIKPEQVRDTFSSGSQLNPDWELVRDVYGRVLRTRTPVEDGETGAMNNGGKSKKYKIDYYKYNFESVAPSSIVTEVDGRKTAEMTFDSEVGLIGKSNSLTAGARKQVPW